MDPGRTLSVDAHPSLADPRRSLLLVRGGGGAVLGDGIGALHAHVGKARRADAFASVCARVLYRADQRPVGPLRRIRWRYELRRHLVLGWFSMDAAAGPGPDRTVRSD